MKKTTRTHILLLLVACFIAMDRSTQNAEAASDSGWTAKPLINRNSKNSGYWDLKYVPGKRINLKLALTNMSSEDKKLNISVKNAVTNQNFTTDYNPTGNAVEKTKSVINLAGISHVNGAHNGNTKAILLKANSKRQIDVEIDLTKHKLVGDVLGGLTVIEQTQKHKQSSLDVQKGYSYAIFIHGKKESQQVRQVAITKIYRKDTRLMMRIKNYSQSVIRNITVEGRLQDNKRHKIDVQLKDKLLVPRANVDVLLIDDPQIKRFSTNTKVDLQVTGDTFNNSYTLNMKEK